MTSTNRGLCQGNMSWCYEVRGASYHWVIDLYDRLKLPVIPAVIKALQKEVEDCMKEIQRGKSDQKKTTRIRMKVARAEDQEVRKNGSSDRQCSIRMEMTWMMMWILLLLQQREK